VPIILLYPCVAETQLPADPQTHLTFLTSLLARITSAPSNSKSEEANVLLLATIARAKLLYGDLEGTKTDMDKAWAVLDRLEGVDNGVNAAYYQVAGDYYKVRLCLFLTVKHRLDFFSLQGESRICAVLPTLAALPCMCT
jgi:hypothetical protein